jgi:hypothetical protein
MQSTTSKFSPHTHLLPFRPNHSHHPVSVIHPSFQALTFPQPKITLLYFHNFTLHNNRVLVGKPEGKRQLGRSRHRWEDKIKADLQEVECESRDWIELAQERQVVGTRKCSSIK